MTLILEELNNTAQIEDLEALIGKVSDLSPRQYSQAAALAIALRYSWRRDQFLWIARRIRALARRLPTNH
jgi:hypothetical protein